MDTDELIQRIKSAVILLNEGHSFKVGDLTFCCKDKNIFSVTGWTTPCWRERPARANIHKKRIKNQFNNQNRML